MPTANPLTYDQMQAAVEDAYAACKDLAGGQNAHYIPYLANVDSNLFGISVCLPNGRVISVGDTDYRLGIESVSKVHTAILVLRQLGGHHRRRRPEPRHRQGGVRRRPVAETLMPEPGLRCKRLTAQANASARE